MKLALSNVGMGCTSAILVAILSMSSYSLGGPVEMLRRLKGDREDAASNAKPLKDAAGALMFHQAAPSWSVEAVTEAPWRAEEEDEMFIENFLFPEGSGKCHTAAACKGVPNGATAKARHATMTPIERILSGSAKAVKGAKKPSPLPNQVISLNTYDLSIQTSDRVKMARHIAEALETEGYIVVKNWYVDPRDVSASGESLVEISKLLGEPVGHDSQNKLVWDIKSTAGTKGEVTTFSEHQYEAELHTDSQYSLCPEDYFGLLTLLPADCGGGESLLLSLKDILAELRARPDGARIERVLREEDYPFIVPTVFKKSKSGGLEFNYGPILRENEIRFRVDTFQKAIEERPDLVSEAQIEAYAVIKQIILNSQAIKRFHLETGDLIFINNKTMLHGRTQFADAKRHLLRVRLNKQGA